MSCTTLPPEIIHHILSDLGHSCSPPEFKSTLKAFSLSCSSWRHLSQNHLFSSVTITQNNSHLKFVTCVAQGDPDAARLSQHIRSLRLIDQPWLRRIEQERLGIKPLNKFMRCHEGLLDAPFITDRIISFLNQLQIIWELSMVLETSWEEICSSGHRALLQLFRLPSLKIIKLDFRNGLPVSLLPFFGNNVQAVCVEACGLSQLMPRIAPETELDCNDPQAEHGPRPVDLRISGASDLELLVSPFFKNPNLVFFTFLRSISIYTTSWDEWTSDPDMHYFRILLESCPHLLKCEIGNFGHLTRRANLEGLQFDLEFDDESNCPSIGNPSDTRRHPCCHATLYIWIQAHGEVYEMVSNLAQMLLRKPLSFSDLPYQPSILPPGGDSLVSAHLCEACCLSDILTSLTLNYHISILPEVYDPIHFPRAFSNMWAQTDNMFSEYFSELQRLSVQIDLLCHDFEIRWPTSSLITEAGNSFLLMSTQLGESDERESGFERKVSTSTIVRSLDYYYDRRQQ